MLARKTFGDKCCRQKAVLQYESTYAAQASTYEWRLWGKRNTNGWDLFEWPLDHWFWHLQTTLIAIADATVVQEPLISQALLSYAVSDHLEQLAVPKSRQLQRWSFLFWLLRDHSEHKSLIRKKGTYARIVGIALVNHGFARIIFHRIVCNIFSIIQVFCILVVRFFVNLGWVITGSPRDISGL